MLSISTISKITQLPLNKIKVIDEKAKKSTKKGKEIIKLTVKRCSKYAKCPYCRHKTKKRYDNTIKIHDNIKHLDHFKYEVVLAVQKRRFCCKHCKTDFVEQYEFIPYTIKDKRTRSKKHTKIFEEVVLFEWAYLTIADIAYRSSVSTKRIWDIIDNLDFEKIKKKGIDHLLKTEGDLYLGIDEHSFSGREMVLVITELKTHKVVAILEDARKKTLKSWINHLPPKVMVRIAVIATDMAPEYKNAVFEALGVENVVSTVDGFHLVKLANHVVMEVRQMNSWMIHMGYYGEHMVDMQMKKGIKKANKRDLKSNKERYQKSKKSEQDSGETSKERMNYNKYRKPLPKALKNLEEYRVYSPGDKEYKAISLDHYLDQKYQKLFLIGEEKLSKPAAHRLNQILIEFDPDNYMKEAWMAKELFREVWSTKDKDLLEKLIRDALSSKHYKIKGFGKSLERWKQAIIDTFEYKTSTAMVEGKNNKIKVIKRQAYGFRNKQNYIKKMLFVEFTK